MIEHCQNGDSFIPERFEVGSEDEETLKQTFFPFGLGKRKCIGMNFAEIKLILATLFQKYDFEFKSDKENIDTEFKMTWAPKDVIFCVQNRCNHCTQFSNIVI